jgi:hypothetical protein
MSWSPETIAQVWEKAKKVYGENPNRFRKDECGAWIAGAHYGNRASEFGWVIERRDPNGGDGLHNLVALQWQNYVDRDEGDLMPVVTAIRSHNVARGLTAIGT